jgi:hypothetical protein
MKLTSPKFEHWWCSPEEACTVDESSIALTELLRYLFAMYSNFDLSRVSLFSIGGEYSDFSRKAQDSNAAQQVTIYFNGENTKLRFVAFQNEQEISQNVDVIASFWNDGGANAMRFPLWLIYHRYYDQGLFIPDTTPKQLAATCINRHDMYGTRTQFIRECLENKVPLVTNLPIQAPGVHMVRLGPTRKDKHDLLKQFMFNICAENTVTPGYTTEKIFHSIEAGCIPLYNGPDPVEPGVINQRRVFRNLSDKLVQAADIIRKLPVWDKHALYNIFLMYLEFWYRIKQAYENKCQTKLVICSDVECKVLETTGLPSIPEVLKKHWEQTRNLFVPLPQIKLGERLLSLEECWEQGYLKRN